MIPDSPLPEELKRQLTTESESLGFELNTFVKVLLNYHHFFQDNPLALFQPVFNPALPQHLEAAWVDHQDLIAKIQELKL